MISEKIRTVQGTCSMPSLPVNPPEPEVSEKAVRRHFTAEYKLNILRQAEGCREPGSLGSLLRREGLYSFHLTTWRRQRDAGILSALKPKQRERRRDSLGDKRWARKGKDVVAREIEGEFIIVPLISGIGDMEEGLFSLNETGKAIWERRDGKRGLKDVVEELSTEFEAPAGEVERDVIGLVEELFKRRMLIEVSGV